ncbi:hypothetical protein FB384_000178 [Prauserella sediminis]|uniref:DUF8017 domain-containing protein n=1 Tax=Prauserella sediminis TaxID=577680 RepID=A0A839XI90_9PSEU|nr:hypothetical protein [Prauserella sediminis]MBB3661274.1 hypothetical protein [Prauserella sediminis]
MIFGRRKRDETSARYGYEDKAALKGVGGYEPADPGDAYRPQSSPTPDPTAHHPAVHRPATPYPATDGQGTQNSATQDPATQNPATWNPAAPGTTPQNTAPHGPATQPQSAPGEPGQQAPPQGSGGQVPPPRVKTSSTKRRGGGWAFVLVVALVYGLPQLLGVFDGDDDTSADPDPVESTSEYTPPPVTRVSVPPAVDGWQSVAGGDGAYAYDVPPEWQPEQGVVHGWEPGGGYDDRFSLSTSAFAGKECDDATHAGGAGVTSYDRPVDAAARPLVEEVSARAYAADGGAKPQVRVAAEDAGRFTGGESGRTRSLIAEVTPAEPGGCVPERAVVGTRAVEAAEGDGTVVALVVYADAQLVSEEDVRRILDSFRGVPESDRSTVTVTPTG